MGKARASWTLALAADACFERGLTPARVSTDTMRRALQRWGVGWRRAKDWITSPDPPYALKNQRHRLMRLAALHPEWVLGFADESWWNRHAFPGAKRPCG